MALPTTPRIADKAPYESIRPVLKQATPLTANVTNTATTATLVTGLSITTPVIPGLTEFYRVTLTADSISNSGANNVIITLWNGTVGSGTQIAQASGTAQSGALSSLDISWIIPATGALVPNVAYTFNVGMHGSGAGTNTLAASATAPCMFTVEAL